MPEFNDVRELLKGKLGCPPNGRIWKNLVLLHRKVVQSAREGPEELETLQGWYHILAEIHEVKPRLSDPPSEAKTIQPDKRLLALAKIAAIEAGRAPLVMLFRKLHLPDGPLKMTAIAAWLREQEQAKAPRSPAFYFRVPIDFKDARAEDILDYSSPEDGDGTLDELESLLSSRYREHFNPTGAHWGREGFAAWLEVLAARVRAGSAEVPADLWQSPSFPCRDGRKPRFVVVGERGVLRHLWDAATGLMEWVPWTLEQAVQFILTDEPREILKASMEADVSTVPALSRLRLTVDPRTSAGEVAQFYERGRGDFSRGRDKPMEDKHLMLAIFCAEHAEDDLKWKELRAIWNAAHREWTYATAEDEVGRRFGRDARAAYKRVTGREWKVGKTLASESGKPGVLLQKDGPIGLRSTAHRIDWHVPWLSDSEEGISDEGPS